MKRPQLSPLIRTSIIGFALVLPLLGCSIGPSKLPMASGPKVDRALLVPPAPIPVVFHAPPQAVQEEAEEAPATMKGPGGTIYSVVFDGSLGRVGVASVNGKSRVRVEPDDSSVVLPSPWKQPTVGNNRFSIVSDSAFELASAVAEATAACLSY